MSETNLTQHPLFAEENDEAMLLPREERAKRYSGKIAEKLEWKCNAILMLLGAGYPVDTISVQLSANKRTVTELAKRSAEKVARFNKEFADILLSTGSRWIGLARIKEDDASFRDLTIGAGIAMQHARDLVAMGEMGEKEIVKEEEYHAAIVAKLREWFEQGAVPSATPGATPGATLPRDGGLSVALLGPADPKPAGDMQSKPRALITSGLGNDAPQRVGVGAEPVPPGQQEGPGEDPAAVEGEGGGSLDRTDGNNPMGELSADCSAKGSGAPQAAPLPAADAGQPVPEKNAAPPAEPAAEPAPGGGS